MKASKKLYTIIMLFFCLFETKAQLIEWKTFYTPPSGQQSRSNYYSWEGYAFQNFGNQYIKPVGTYRALNILVNIIWDQTPANNPCQDNNGIWDNAVNEGINNEAIPISSFMTGFLDSDYNPNNVVGYMTRLYHESSFGNLVILGDWTVVNIKQSTITPNNPGNSFSYYVIAQKAVDLINVNGLNSLYGHNLLSDYDNNNDNIIDVVNIMYRNPNSSLNSISIGSGYSGGFGNTIKINGNFYSCASATFNGVGNGNISNGCQIITHEIAHQFFGSNAFHTSGGNHYGTSEAVSSIGIQGGYGLMGCYGSSLLSCNGYERWRMHWKSSTYNTSPYYIAANNLNSDIQKTDGNKTFILRDFVTTGDAVRIKLPYKDNSNCSYQYIWLENHQVGVNNKIDYMQYSNTHSCRKPGTAGIYAYIQVGRDILESTSSSDVWPSAETDNLKQISAEGNWDMTLMDPVIPNCVAWSSTPTARTEMINLSNPLMGYNDLLSHFFDQTGTTSTLSGSNGCGIFKKYYSTIKYNDSIPNLGDVYDAFTGTKIMSIGTNPSSCNLATYYLTQYENQNPQFQPSSTQKNNSKIYLSGLAITMTDLQNGTYQASIVWDDYNINNDVRWTGEVVLKEQLNLASDKTISIDQNYTPYKIYKDALTGVFASTTKFNAENGSTLTLQSNSKIELNNLSAFTLESGSTMNINDGGKLVVKQGCSLIIKSGANLNIYNNGSIEIENGGYICIENGANVNLSDYLSVINLRSGYISGVNPNIGITASCTTDPVSFSVSGNGEINTFSSDEYIQNITINTNKYFNGINISAGYDVTTSIPYGNVIIQSPAKVILDATNEILLKNSIEIQSGSTFEMK